MRTVLRDPGEPLDVTVTPGTCPSSRCSTLVVLCFSMFPVLTIDTAPMMSARFCGVYPVTTTSGNTAMAFSSATSMLVLPPMLCAISRSPIRANVRTPSEGAVREYRPSASVTVLVSVPLMRTVTPWIGVPAWEVTRPDTTSCCWPNAGAHTPRANSIVTPTARRIRLPWNMSFMAVPSSCG